METSTLKISSVVGSPHWVDPADGRRIFQVLRERILEGKSIRLDFGAKDIVITAFLNAAIGPLFSGEFTSDQIELVSYVNTSGDDDELILRVCENAKLYYANKKDIDDAWSDEFDEE